MDTAQQIISLVRLGVFGQPLQFELDSEVLTRLYPFFSGQDMAHVVGVALEQQGQYKGSEAAKPYLKAKHAATFRMVQMENALSEIAALFEEAEIPFIPLKGSVIRYLYPDPVLRTSCDIDIYVAPETLEKAVNVLTEQGGYTKEKQSTGHDISLYSLDRVHIELHFELMDADKRMGEALKDPFLGATKKDGKQFWYVQSEEMLLLYHTAHMAKHFAFGGCGIRPLLDLHILREKLTFDQNALDTALEKAGLLGFYRGAVALSLAWFGDGVHTKLTKAMEEYIFRGGVFGTVENHAQSSLAKNGRVGLFLRRLFPRGEYMKKRYPKAQKHPILLPWFYLWRMLCFLVRADAKDKVKIHFEVAKAGDTEDTKRSLWMMRELGMDQNELL